MIYHKKALTLIRALSRRKEYVVDAPGQPLDRLSAKIRYKKNRIEFVPVAAGLPIPCIRAGVTVPNIIIGTSPQRIVLHGLYFNAEHNFLPSGGSGSAWTVGYQNNRPYYFRLILPLEQELAWHYNIATAIFETDLGYRSRTGLVVRLGSEIITVCPLFEEKKNIKFLSIESTLKQKRESFWHKANGVLCGIGYLTGTLPGDAGFFFAYQRPDMETFQHFYFSERSATIRHSYHPVYSNAYGYLHKRPELAKVYYERKILRPLNEKEFGTLCQKIIQYDAFQNAIVLIMEVMSSSTGLMPGGLAMALESLTDVILGDKHVSLGLIQDPQLKKTILKGFREVITPLENSLGPETFKILSGKVDNINQGTNRARLKAPFAHLKIRLSKKDIAVIGTRDDLLHGRIPDIRGRGPGRDPVRKSRDAYYAAMRLYTLINILILKWCGYNNYVLNNPELQNHICQVPLREKPYRKV